MATSSLRFDTKVHAAQSLNDLPNELILNVLSRIDPHASERILGHIPDDPPRGLLDPYLIRDFLECNQSLYSIALTSRRFRDVAQEQLLYAPVIGGYAFRKPGGSTGPSRSRVLYLLRTLFVRPDLRRHVRRLRLCFPPLDSTSFLATSQYELSEFNMSAEPVEFSDIVCQGRGMISSLDLPNDLKLVMSMQLSLDTRHALTGMFMILLPQLGVLSFSDDAAEVSQPWELDDRHLHPNLGGILMHRLMQADELSLPYLAAAATLTRIKVSSAQLIRLDGVNRCPQVDTLDISMKLAGLNHNQVRELLRLFCEPYAITDFQRIRHLRIDCQVKSVGVWDLAARSCLSHLLLPFKDLKSLDYYAEPASEKNPFRSVRAFPQYQANIQAYPDEGAHVAEGTYWDERIYNARTQFTDYQYLVDSLVHVREGLESLRLPGGFWTLPGAMRKPLPRFELFPSLHTLGLPQAAILSLKLDNMRFPEIVKGDFELLPTQVLPPKLRNLKIFDADAWIMLSPWLEELFTRQAECNQWPNLTKLELLVGPLIDDFDLGRWIRREYPSLNHFWKLVDKASFRVVVSRDNEVPAVHGIH
ncbi:hypothetical protein EK21DRAFT_87443 [Setomelanomma holmii]|uniref:F-box domain-containing protein n=1 Tax=Setomelanomma holmii TaxID=210430 RepID=A0A9P4HEE8_9PLEO|nr:hypothetical protein EK21DRAFT_87443 [Setomelanomma holmii]